jgi:hypothetical protein
MLDIENAGALIKRAPYQNQRSKSMKMKMKRNTVYGGKVAYVGEVIEVKERDVPMLLRSGKAEIYKKGEKKAKTVETATNEPNETAVSRSDKSKRNK